MKLLGSLTDYLQSVFKKDSQDITLRPNQSTTYTASRDIQLPPGDAAHVIVSADSTQAFENKTITDASNDISATRLTSGTIPDARVPSSAVTQHEASITISNLSGTLGIGNGGTGQTTQTTAFDALAPTTTKGDVIVHNGTDNIRLAVGSDGQVLSADSGQASGLAWTSPLTNPMDSNGDLIVGGASGAATKLDHPGAANYVLATTGASTTAWDASPTINALTVVGDLTVDTNTLYVDSVDNRVGIGNTNPLHSLHVSGNDIRLGNRIQTDSANDIIRLGSSGITETVSATGVVIDFGSTNNQLYLTRTSASGVWLYGNTGLKIAEDSGSGSVGTERFDFEISSGNAKTQVFSDNSDIAAAEYTDSGTGSFTSVGQQHLGSGRSFIVNSNDAGDCQINLGFGTITSGIPANAVLTILRSGNVGVGDPDPSQELTVSRDQNGDTLVRTNNANSGASARSGLQLEGDGGIALIVKNSTGNSSDGGTDTLNVINESGGVYLSPGSTSWSAVSDMRYKTKIEDYTNALDKIRNLSVFTYILNAEQNDLSANNRIELGLSAQEVQPVIPEVIHGNINTKMGISYDRLVPVLIKALQELETRLNILEG